MRLRFGGSSDRASHVLVDGVARVSPASAAVEFLLFACPKRSNQEKGTPASRVACCASTVPCVARHPSAGANSAIHGLKQARLLPTVACATRRDTWRPGRARAKGQSKSQKLAVSFCSRHPSGGWKRFTTDECLVKPGSILTLPLNPPFKSSNSTMDPGFCRDDGQGFAGVTARVSPE